MMLVNSGVHTLKYFSENYQICRHTALKAFANTVLGRKSLRNMFQGAPTFWTGRDNYYMLYQSVSRPSLILHVDRITNIYSNFRTQISYAQADKSCLHQKCNSTLHDFSFELYRFRCTIPRVTVIIYSNVL